MARFTRMQGGLVAAGLFVFGAALPATAASYYSATSPLTAWQDGQAQAQMYGSFSISNLTYARNTTKHRDARPGGDAAYEETFYDWYDSEGTFRTNVGTDTSEKTTSYSWYSQYDQHPLHGCCTSVRMYTNVCEDHGVWGKDPCSVRPTQHIYY